MHASPDLAPRHEAPRASCHWSRGALLLAAACASGPASANPTTPLPGGLQFRGGGFYTLAAAKALRVRAADTEYRLRCDCFVAEYSQGGVYEDGEIGWRGDSKLGLQGSVSTSDDRWSLTGQAVARGARNGRVNLEWFYVTHELDGNWTFQLGRKRLPLLSMSDVQDVGLAYPWVRLPPQIYGWDIVNYNGANARWRGEWGRWAVSANAFAGRETEIDSAYQALYYTDGTRTDTRWSGIRGLEIEVGTGDAKLRGAILKARNQNRFTYPMEPRGDWGPPVPLRIATLAFSAEPGRWMLRAEYLYGDRQQEYGTDKGWLLAGGRRFGDLQLVFTRSYYVQIANELSIYAQADTMNSVVLRWDAAPGRAWKVQLDDARDRSSPNFSIGSRRMLSVSVSGSF